jgi:Putative beta-barrel porin 2
VALRHELTPLTSVAMTVNRNHDRFDVDPWRDSNSLGIYSGLEFKPFALIDGKAYVGWARYKLVEPGSPSFNGLVTAVDLGYTLLSATRFAIQAERDVEYSAIKGQHAYLYSGVTGSVNHRLGDSWVVGVRTGWHVLSYGLLLPESELGGGANDANEEIVTEFGGEVGYSLGPDTRLAFQVARHHRRSTVGSAREYERVRAGMSLSCRF